MIAPPRPSRLTHEACAPLAPRLLTFFLLVVLLVSMTVGAPVAVAAEGEDASPEAGGWAIAATRSSGLQIAPLGAAATWTNATSGDWVVANAGAGSRVQGGVQLRTTTPLESAAMFFDVTFEGGPGVSRDALLEALQVTAMSLDGIDLLPRWGACTSGMLTLRDIADCAVSPALPPPEAGGSTFLMDLTLAMEVTNEAQGASTGPITFTFTLEAAEPPGVPGTPSASDAPDTLPAPHEPPAPGRSGVGLSGETGLSALPAAVALLCAPLLLLGLLRWRVARRR